MAYNKLKTLLDEDFSSSGKTAIYVRVSTDMQADRDSIPTQKKDLINYTKLILGIEDYEIFEDAGYSGKNTNRPAFQEMMKRIRQNEFTHLLVWKLDRVSRNLIDFSEMYEELHEHNVTFVSKNEQFQTNTAMGKAMLRIILVFAEMEREITSERVSAVMVSRAAEGKWNGGRVPYGYDYDASSSQFTINEKEAEVVKEMFELCCEGVTLTKLANHLNSQNLLTRKGNVWSPPTLHRILTSEWYAGYYVYNRTKQGNGWEEKKEADWIRIENHHDAIVSLDKVQQCISLLWKRRKNMNTNQQERTSKENYVHIFQKKLTCMQCGKLFSSHPGKLRVSGWYGTRYLCPTKRRYKTDCKNTSDAVVGDFVFNFILHLLNARKNIEQIRSPKALQDYLLSGKNFEKVAEIDTEGLHYTYNMLTGNLTESETLESANKHRKSNHMSEIAKLKEEQAKLERALLRLKNLYLYEDETLSEKDYIIERTRITTQLDDIIAKISELEIADNGFEQNISNEELNQIASRYILSQSLNGREDIDFESLTTFSDRGLIKLLIDSIIQMIYMDHGRVRTITFTNGISYTFKYKDE